MHRTLLMDHQSKLLMGHQSALGAAGGALTGEGYTATMTLGVLKKKKKKKKKCDG